MKKYHFDKKQFFTTIVSYLFSSLIWTFLCIRLNEFTDNDKGLVSGLGFLMLFSTSFHFSQKTKSFFNFLFLTLSIILTFLFASFIMAPVIGLTSNSVLIYAIINSIVTPIILTYILDKFYGIEFKGFTVGLSITFALLAYLIISIFSDRLHMLYDFNPRLTMFNVFQSLLIFPLTFGLVLKRVKNLE
jgi:hypothetical protein